MSSVDDPLFHESFNSNPDPNLVTRYQPEEIDRLMEMARPVLRGLASNLVRSDLERRIDPSDLVQETLLKGLAQIQQFHGTTENEFFAWLQQIFRNSLIDSVRHHTRQIRDVRRETQLFDFIPGTEVSPSSILRGKEDQTRVVAALQQLRDDQRQVLLLRSEGLKFEEIGQRIGRSPDAARMLWGRSILSLGKLLKADAATPKPQ